MEKLFQRKKKNTKVRVLKPQGEKNHLYRIEVLTIET